jgi:hypothetical protein
MVIASSEVIVARQESRPEASRTCVDCCHPAACAGALARSTRAYLITLALPPLGVGPGLGLGVQGHAVVAQALRLVHRTVGLRDQDVGVDCLGRPHDADACA